jgi:cytoskeletal protein CcmA (bactofilin family)
MHTGRGLTIKGDLTATEDVTIDFAFEGAIDLPGHQLTVAPGARVQAAVSAKSVAVHGSIEGHVSAERLELAATAVVEASVMAAKLLLHDGAQLTGPVNTERAQAAGSLARHRQKSATEE